MTVVFVTEVVLLTDGNLAAFLIYADTLQKELPSKVILTLTLYKPFCTVLINRTF